MYVITHRTNFPVSNESGRERGNEGEREGESEKSEWVGFVVYFMMSFMFQIYAQPLLWGREREGDTTRTIIFWRMILERKVYRGIFLVVGNALHAGNSLCLQISSFIFHDKSSHSTFLCFSHTFLPPPSEFVVVVALWKEEKEPSPSPLYNSNVLCSACQWMSSSSSWCERVTLL